MRPLEFYRLGQRLAESANTEVERRTVVSRLYYGLHHEACCRYFREYPYDAPLPRNGRHTALIHRYGGKPGTGERDIARELNNIRRMRNTSDYELGHPVRFGQRTLGSAELMHFALIVADSLLAALEDFSPGEAPDGCDCPTARV